MRRRLAVIGVAALLAWALATPALAVESLLVQNVDTTDYPRMVLTIVVSPDAVTVPGEVPDVLIAENGVEIADIAVSSLADERKAIDVVLLMDTSGSMRGQPLADAKAAGRKFVESMRTSDRIAVVAFSSEPRVVQEFTSDRGVLYSAIEGLTASGETALYDGLVQAAGLLGASPAAERYIVALSDGGDTLSLNPPDNAARAVTDAKAPVYAVALESPEYNPATLETIARVSGGRITSTSDSNSLTEIYRSIAEEMQLRYRVECVSGRPNTPELALDVTVGSGAEAKTTGVSVQNPLFVASAGLSGDALEPARPSGIALGIALMSLFGAVTTFAAATLLIFRRDRAALDQLRYYDQLRAAGSAEGRLADETTVRGGLLTALGGIAERRGFTGLVQRWLDSAGLVLRANEYIFFHLVATIAIALLVRFLTAGSTLATVGALLAAVVLPIGFLRLKASQRLKAFESQMPDILDLIAGSLRSGWGIQQSIDLVVDEVGDPAKTEFRRTQAEARLGLPLEEALQRMADRIDSADLRWTVSAISIQREVGGNLAEVLNAVARTIRERAELQRMVHALTAEGRFSAIVLTVLPFLVFGLMFVVNPEYMMLALTSPVGVGALVTGGLLLIVGIVWLNRVMRIEV